MLKCFQQNSVFTTVYCKESIPNGGLSDSCSKMPGTMCDYTCNTGYERNNPATITCLPSGAWDYPTNQLCRSKSKYLNFSKLSITKGTIIRLYTFIEEVDTMVYRAEENIFPEGGGQRK